MMQAYRGALPKEAERGHQHGIPKRQQPLAHCQPRIARKDVNPDGLERVSSISLPRCGEVARTYETQSSASSKCVSRRCDRRVKCQTTELEMPTTNSSNQSTR